MMMLLHVFRCCGFRRRPWSPVRDPICEQGAKPAGFVPVITVMLRPADGAGKPLCLPRRSKI